MFRRKNGGYGAAVNHALALAQGEYFKTVDGDDWVDTKELLTVVCYLMDNRRKIRCCRDRLLLGTSS